MRLSFTPFVFLGKIERQRSEDGLTIRYLAKSSVGIALAQLSLCLISTCNAKVEQEH